MPDKMATIANKIKDLSSEELENLLRYFTSPGLISMQMFIAEVLLEREVAREKLN